MEEGRESEKEREGVIMGEQREMDEERVMEGVGERERESSCCSL